MGTGAHRAVRGRAGLLPGEDAPWVDETRHQLTELRLRALECYAASALGVGGTELSGAVQAGEAAIRQVTAEAGFTRFRRAAETPFNPVYEVRP